MSQKTCKGCGGQYDDGTGSPYLYFHACPDSILPAAARNENVAIVAGQVQIIAAGAGVTAGAAVIAPQFKPGYPPPPPMLAK